MQIVFILVRPAVPENVGAAARALKTMGFAELRIVGSAAHLAKPARILAHGAGDILDAARQFATLAEALADVDLAIGTSAKRRHDKRYNLEPAAVRQAIAAKAGVIARAAVVFGCEESGLANEELALCHALTSIPLAVSYPSLNLAQAVMLYAWELSSLAGVAAAPSPVAPAAGEWQALRARLEQLLTRIGAPEAGVLRDWLAERSVLLTSEDVRLAHLLCATVEKALERDGKPG